MNNETKFNLNGKAFMTTTMGDLPVDSDGMRTLADEVARLQAENQRLNRIVDVAVNSSDIQITTPIGVLPVTPDGMRRLSAAYIDASTRNVKAVRMYNSL